MLKCVLLLVVRKRDKQTISMVVEVINQTKQLNRSKHKNKQTHKEKETQDLRGSARCLRPRAAMINPLCVQENTRVRILTKSLDPLYTQ